MTMIRLFVLAFAACISFLAGAPAQTRTGSETSSLGNTWCGINQTTAADCTVGATTASSTVRGVTTAHLLRLSREASSRVFSSTQNGVGNRATIRLVGATVRDQALVPGVVQTMPMTYRTVFSLRRDILDLGLATLSVEASAGAGTQFTVVARNRTGNSPAAHLSGPFQAFVAGEGSVRVSLLSGLLGSASATVRVEGLNTTGYITLATERSNLTSPSMTLPLDTLAWRFTVKGKVEGPFGITLASRTFVDVQGPRAVVDILNR